MKTVMSSCRVSGEFVFLRELQRDTAAAGPALNSCVISIVSVWMACCVWDLSLRPFFLIFRQGCCVAYSAGVFCVQNTLFCIIVLFIVNKSY